MQTKLKQEGLERVCFILQMENAFCVDRIRMSGGWALLWDS